MPTAATDAAKEHFGRLLEEQLARVEQIKKSESAPDFAALKPVIVGVCGGDGIGPFITAEAERVLRHMLTGEVESGKIEFRTIEGLTIENRAAHNKAIPGDVLAELRKCHVILKGPTTTPRQGDPWPNIESANVAMRKELDLFANVRPVRVPEQGIDWIFFRENTEDIYALGAEGIMVGDDLAIDFKLTTRPGSERIIRMAFDFAEKNGLNRLTVVTKANVVKTSDGLFLDTARAVSTEYPTVQWDDWYIDIMTAKLVDARRRTDFRVFVLPNLYGDILTDEAAEFQGGVGTAGSANIGTRYSMFEAIHGSAPRMVDEGRAQYADPSSMIRAGSMMLRHIGFGERAEKLEQALDIAGRFEKKLVMTGRADGATSEQFGDYILGLVKDASLGSRWQDYQAKLVAL